MSFFINPVAADQCVFLTYEGAMPPIEIAAARYEANEALAARHWNRIVVDITELESRLEAAELFELGRVLSSDLPQSARVALVVRAEQARSARLVESIARNDGLFIKFFFDVEKATAWVKGLVHREGIKCPQINERV